MRIIQLIKTTNKNNDFKKTRIIQLIKTMIIRKWELSN